MLGGLATPYPGAMSITPGTVTPGFATSSRIDLNQIGEARNSMLSIKLDQVGIGYESSCFSLSLCRFQTQFLVKLL